MERIFMLVMEITPIDGRRYKHREFVKCDFDTLPYHMLLDVEMRTSKRLFVKSDEVMTINVVKLQ